MASKLLLTGRPGVGKTTVVRAVVGAGVRVAGGFVTEEIRQSGRRLGFGVQDVHSGERGTLAHVDRKGPPRVGKYGVDVAAFDRIGVAGLREALGRAGCIIIDELGKMELCSAAFREAVTAVMDSDRPVLATIPAYRLAFVDRLRQRQDVTIVEVIRANRDGLPQRIVEMLGCLDRSAG